MGQTLWKEFGNFYWKLNVQALYHLAIVLLGTYPREMKISVHMKTCTQMFRAALLVIALFTNWKQPQSPQTDEWIKQQMHKHKADSDAGNAADPH